MNSHGAPKSDGVCSGGLSRREIVAGGGLLLGSMFLSACAKVGGAGSAERLPETYWGPQTAAAPTFGESRTATVSAPPVSIATMPQPISEPGLMPIIPRSQWARIGVARPNEIFAMNGIRRITVHHDGMPPASLTTSRQIAARIEQIRQSHVVGRGWADLGYHYVIDPTGRIWEGRSIQWQGAHVKDQNENNLGILVMGNFQAQSPTPSALATLDKFLVNQMQRYRIGMMNVRTHQERAPTECPGRNLQQYMVRTRSGGGNLYAMAQGAGLMRG